ncbi:MAG: hypothetical protein J4G09_03940 [Proteobacteria bacterium]|nr:hypothetical protein [Pseudomonadota bacterium]
MSGRDPNLALLASFEEEIASLRQECARLPGVVAGFEAQAQQARDRIAAAREELKSAEKEHRTREAQLQDYEQQKSHFQGQSALVKTNAEYTALLAEIDGMSTRIEETEDEILGLMERIELAHETLAVVESEQTALEAEANRQADEQRASLERATDLLQQRQSERDSLVLELDPLIQRAYARASSQGGMPVARIRAGSCSACHRSIPPEVENRVLAGDLHTCQNCFAILVVDPPD